MVRPIWILRLLFGWMYFNYSGVSSTVLPCAENRTELCIQNLSTFINLDKPRFVNEAELERLCREAEDGQRCSSDFLRSPSCVNSEDQLLISLQVGRSQAVSQMLCNTGGYFTDPVFRNLYLKHSSCIDEHQKQIKDCFTSAGIVEDPELEILKNSTKTVQEKHTDTCCPVVQYVECSENSIERNCGTESRVVVERILLKIAGKQLEEFCKNEDPNFPNNPLTCVNTAVSLVATNCIYLMLILTALLIYVFF